MGTCLVVFLGFFGMTGTCLVLGRAIMVTTPLGTSNACLPSYNAGTQAGTSRSKHNTQGCIR